MLLKSVSVVDEETAKQEKKLAAKKIKYYADKLVIDNITEITSREPLDLTKLIDHGFTLIGVIRRTLCLLRSS